MMILLHTNQCKQILDTDYQSHLKLLDYWEGKGIWSAISFSLANSNRYHDCAGTKSHSLLRIAPLSKKSKNKS